MGRGELKEMRYQIKIKGVCPVEKLQGIHIKKKRREGASRSYPQERKLPGSEEDTIYGRGYQGLQNQKYRLNLTREGGEKKRGKELDTMY